MTTTINQTATYTFVGINPHTIGKVLHPNFSSPSISSISFNASLTNVKINAKAAYNNINLKNLKKKNIEAAAIHGDKSQNQRQNALKSFKDGGMRVLVATDIAARGIDINELRHVLNYNIPNESETYVHRIGRCGRAGKEGISISISGPEENAYIRDIEKLIGKKIDAIKDHPFPQTDKPMNAQEKKEFEKEKNRKKQEFFANRKKKKANYRK